MIVTGTKEAVEAHLATPEGAQLAEQIARAIFEDGDRLTDFELGESRFAPAVERWLDYWIERRNAKEDA